jgi:hypothetical protein
VRDVLAAYPGAFSHRELWERTPCALIREYWDDIGRLEQARQAPTALQTLVLLRVNGDKAAQLEDMYTGRARSEVYKELGFTPRVEAAIRLALKRDMVSQAHLELLGLSDRKYLSYLRHISGEG